MIKNIAHYVSLILLSLALITHFFKAIYLFYKPMFLQKIKYLSNDIPSRLDLVLYYILTMGACYYAIVHLINT
jgi:hypothetical protein